MRHWLGGTIVFAVALGLYTAGFFVPWLRHDLPGVAAMEYHAWHAENANTGSKVEWWDDATDETPHIGAIRSAGPLVAGALGCALAGIVMLVLSSRMPRLRGLAGVLGVVGALAALTGAILYAWAINDNIEGSPLGGDLGYAPGIFLVGAGAIASAAAAPAGFRRRAPAPTSWAGGQKAPEPPDGPEPPRPSPPKAAGKTGPRTLTCPRCATSVPVAPGQRPVCPSCGYGKPASKPKPAT